MDGSQEADQSSEERGGRVSEEKQGNGKSVMVRMASTYGMEVAKFQRTLMATIIPGGNASPEQVAAFCVVADRYGLDPFCREIYAFPSRSGGIVPVVGVDGWLRKINEHPQMAGMKIEMREDDGGRPVSCTVTIMRKDREWPVQVTEHFSECARNTDPWKAQPHRMLRHKAVIQAGRVAFGLSGIFDPDEAERIAEAEMAVQVREVSAEDMSDLTKRLEEENKAAEEPQDEPDTTSMPADWEDPADVEHPDAQVTDKELFGDIGYK